jgi:hypothetical protein
LFSRIITKSNNKIKTKWNIVKKEIEKCVKMEQVPSIIMNDEKLKDPKKVAGASNKHFLTVTEK